jgi:hypothetical protein
MVALFATHCRCKMAARSVSDGIVDYCVKIVRAKIHGRPEREAHKKNRTELVLLLAT